MGIGVSIRAYAKHRGCSHVAVMKAIKDGRMTTLPDGSINPGTADLEWKANTEVKPALVAAAALKIAGVARPVAVTAEKVSAAVTPLRRPPPVSPPLDRTRVPDYMESKALREQYLAELARLDFEQQSEKLIEVDEVKSLWSKLIAETKTRLLSVGSKSKALIPHLAAEDVAIIDVIIREALEEIAECPLPAKS